MNESSLRLAADRIMHGSMEYVTRTNKFYNAASLREILTTQLFSALFTHNNHRNAVFNLN
jgi:hypothetical protein